ncbi:hypothetical protein J7I98_39235 [Streptomyces sp. ISL-98]|uniref:hypothetical protein n=1 Tax=Streptomyces sp. ISL-98 TaxID=2819192 RepID=UPI001BE9E927|nr:hypothetical protein [Streptomyces sp. ISL-98]MBT2511710.1 hypothetical protein [Streptomyces sp. ISL-98]
MAMIGVTCHKGTGSQDEKKIQVDPKMKLDRVRKELETSGFIAPDGAGHKFRFVELTAASLPDLNQPGGGTVSPSNEEYLPLHKYLRNGNFFVTNIDAPRPDLLGIRSGFFEDRHLFVRVRLNNGDGAKENADINAFDPIMLTNVKPTNPDTPAGYFENVCVVVENSVVAFDLCSFAAAGYNYTIEPGIATRAKGGLAVCRQPGDGRQYLTTTSDRYGDVARTIRIVGADRANVHPSRYVRFQKVTFTTRRLTKVYGDGQKVELDTQPPNLNRADPRMWSLAPEPDSVAREQLQVIPGSSVKVGGPTQGSFSKTKMVGAGWEGDDWTRALGQVTVYFFVFRSWDDAHKVVSSYNAPESTTWN